jgi:hypothetical protein
MREIRISFKQINPCECNDSYYIIQRTTRATTKFCVTCQTCGAYSNLIEKTKTGERKVTKNKQVKATVSDVAVWGSLPNKWYKIQKIMMQRCRKKPSIKYYKEYIKYLWLRLRNK